MDSVCLYVRRKWQCYVTNSVTLPVTSNRSVDRSHQCVCVGVGVYARMCTVTGVKQLFPPLGKAAMKENLLSWLPWQQETNSSSYLQCVCLCVCWRKKLTLGNDMAQKSVCVWFLSLPSTMMAELLLEEVLLKVHQA